MKIANLSLLLVLAPSAALAQLPGVTESRISSPQHAGSDVVSSSLIFSPDGAYVCFVGDTETDGAGELWCAATDSGQPAVRVSALMPSGKSVLSPQFDAEGERLFYLAPGADAEKRELFMAVPDGSQPPVRLSAPMAPPGANVADYRFLPETDQVIYTAPSQVIGQSRLHVVSVNQPEVATVLNGPLVPGGTVEQYAVVPAAGRVVYLADQQTDDVLELYSVLLNGSGAVKLNGPMVAGGDVWSFKVSPDGARVAYRADEEANGVREIFISSIEGGGSTKVSGTAVAGGETQYFVFSPDSQWLLFTGDLATDGWRDLYSTPADGSQSTPNLLGAQVEPVPAPLVREIDPAVLVMADGSQVVFQSAQGNPSTIRVLRAPIDGSSGAVVLSGGLTQINSLRAALGLDRILVRNGTAPGNLYSIAVDASSFVPLTNFTSASIDVSFEAVSGGVLYFADPVVDGRTSMFFVDYFGQERRELSSTNQLFQGLVSSPVTFLPEDRRAVYFVERHGSPSILLYSFRLKVVDLDSFAVAELARINNSMLMPERAFLRMLPSPSNRYQVAYIADKDANDQADAYLARFSNTAFDALFTDRFQND